MTLVESGWLLRVRDRTILYLKRSIASGMRYSSMFFADHNLTMRCKMRHSTARSWYPDQIPAINPGTGAVLCSEPPGAKDLRIHCVPMTVARVKH
jgi:hypothetical protein